MHRSKENSASSSAVGRLHDSLCRDQELYAIVLEQDSAEQARSHDNEIIQDIARETWEYLAEETMVHARCCTHCGLV